MRSTPPTTPDRDSPTVAAHHDEFFASCLEFVSDEHTPGDELWTMYKAYNGDHTRHASRTRRAAEDRAPMWRSLERAGAERFTLSDRVQFSGVRIKPAVYRRAFMRPLMQKRRAAATKARDEAAAKASANASAESYRAAVERNERLADEAYIRRALILEEAAARRELLIAD